MCTCVCVCACVCVHVCVCVCVCVCVSARNALSRRPRVDRAAADPAQFMKETIQKENKQRAKALPPITPRAESPRGPRYWKAPGTPDSPWASRTPPKFDRVPQPRGEVFDESQHCSRRAGDRSGLTPGRIVVGQSYSPRWSTTVQQTDFSPRELPRGVTEFRRGASKHSDPNVFTAYLRESVRKQVDLTCTGHPV